MSGTYRPLIHTFTPGNPHKRLPSAISSAGLSAMIIGRTGLFVIAGCLRASVMYPMLLVLDE